MSNCQVLGVIVRFPTEVHPQSAFIRVVLAREVLTCSEIGASRTVGSETIDTNILRSDANRSLQDLPVSSIGLNFIIEATACFMIAVNMGGLKSLKVWADVFDSGRAQGVTGTF